MLYIERKEYLNWLVRHRDRQIVKVVSGVRRCGKSTLFAMFGQYLQEHSVAREQIVSINFEDLVHENLLDYRELYRYVVARLAPDRKTYVFLDEIQHVPMFQKAVDSLLLKENCDLYLTGSNAYFMSGELATLLTGRYVELEMLPWTKNGARFPATRNWTSTSALAPSRMSTSTGLERRKPASTCVLSMRVYCSTTS